MSGAQSPVRCLQGYSPPNEPASEYQTIPMNKIEDFGVHCKSYYPLDISFFKSSLDAHLLDLLWHKYWVNTLSSSPLVTTRHLAAGQFRDVGEPPSTVRGHVDSLPVRDVAHAGLKRLFSSPLGDTPRLLSTSCVAGCQRGLPALAGRAGACTQWISMRRGTALPACQQQTRQVFAGRA